MKVDAYKEVQFTTTRSPKIFKLLLKWLLNYWIAFLGTSGNGREEAYISRPHMALTLKIKYKTSLLFLFFCTQMTVYGQFSSKAQKFYSQSTIQTKQDTLAKKRFGRGLFIWSLAEVVPWAYDHYYANEDWAHITLKSLKHNLKPGSWTWDNDDFRTNQFAHPTHGSIFFNAYRSSGYNFWQSVPAAFAGSYVWETAGEEQAPSINDFINTGFGGVVLGETLHRFSSRLVGNRSRGFKKQFSEIFALVLNPAGGLNRLMDGKWGKHPANQTASDSTRIQAEFDIGLRSFNLRNQKNGHFGWFGHVKMRYGTPFENYKIPFGYIVLNGEFGKDDTAAVNVVRVYGSLAGWPVDLSDSIRHTILLTANFDYIDNQVFSYSAESIKINLFSECKLPGRFLITTSVGIGPILLAAVPDPYPYQGRPYDYCSGAELSISGEINFARRFFYSLTYNGAWLKTLNGNSTEYLLHTLTSACRYRFIKEFSIGAEPGYLIVKNHFKNGISNYKTYPYFRIFFRYGVEL